MRIDEMNMGWQERNRAGCCSAVTTWFGKHRVFSCFKSGTFAALGTVGVFNVFSGFIGVVQGLKDENIEFVGIGGCALGIGLIQTFVAIWLFIRAREAGEGHSLVITGIAGLGAWYSGFKVAELVMDQISSRVGQIAVAVSVQTVASMVIGGVAAAIMIPLRNRCVSLYHAAREAQMRRKSPDQALVLIPSNRDEVEND